MPTPYTGIPIPGTIDAPNNPAAFAAALSQMEQQGFMTFADATARDAVITTPNRKRGMVAFLYNSGVFTRVNANGGSWLPFQPASWQRSGAAVTGIANPASSIPNVDGLIVKTGQNTFFTTLSFGNEYASLVTYDTPFPNACLSVTITQLYVSGDTIPFPEATRAGVAAIDTMNANNHRLVYVYASGTPASIKRSYLYTAIGY